MQFRTCLMAAMLISMAMSLREAQAQGAERGLREPGVAGSFYPAAPSALTAMMDGMLAQASPPHVEGKILAAVAPHAGYEYSGPVAAYTYAALKGRTYSRVVVIAPSHFESFDFTSVYDGDAYVTPLGTIQVDKEFAHRLAKMNSSIQLSGRGHRPTAQGAEHAIEVQLPWLQRVLGNFTLVPIVMGDQSYESSRALGVALAKLVHEEDAASHHGESGATLILASSDLSHYHTYRDAETMDRKTLHALESWDYFSMSRNFESRVWEACGGAPIVAAMIAAERLGANEARVLKYANSGDVTGDRSRVVGYSADIFVKGPDAKTMERPFTLSEGERAELLGIARKSVEQAVRARSLYDPGPVTDEVLNQERGTFVTVTEAGSLRGCVGYTAATKPLYLSVRDTAMLAAMRDPRFAPVAPQELPALQYEVSVLSPLRRVQDVGEIHIGQHGLLMKNGANEGLLLPQVPVEQQWDHKRFLEETCVKAGLPRDCWKSEDTDIFAFTAVVFGEHATGAQ